MQESSSEQEINSIRASIAMLNSNLDRQNQRKNGVLNELLNLQEKIRKEGAESNVQKFVSLLENLKLLERQEPEIRSDFDTKRSSLEAEELAARLRAIVSIKRQLDDAPSQSELIQYERRVSELNAHIQEKLQQTRKFYATYNALLEIKDLMLKETSLLNSISSQFQDAISSPTGRMKLLESMEGIVKGSQQKLEKVQLGLQEEQKVCDALKEKYTAAVAEQRRCYSLLKAFQEECARNERLRSQTSAQLLVDMLKASFA